MSAVLSPRAAQELYSAAWLETLERIDAMHEHSNGAVFHPMFCFIDPEVPALVTVVDIPMAGHPHGHIRVALKCMH